MTRFAMLVSAVMAISVLGGCQTRSSAQTTDAELLALQVIVKSSPLSGHSEPQQRRIASRAAVYVLGQDGSLTVWMETDRSGQPTPVAQRRLNAAEMERISSLVEQVSPEGAPSPPRNPALIHPQPGEVVHIVDVTWTHGRAMIEQRLPGADPTRLYASSLLVQALADLVWLEDEPAMAGRTVPRRYDFGPDPYAQYR